MEEAFEGSKEEDVVRRDIVDVESCADVVGAALVDACCPPEDELECAFVEDLGVLEDGSAGVFDLGEIEEDDEVPA